MNAEPADAPLRRDVRLLGETLGRVLVEQGGEALLADEEHIRKLSRRARASGSAAARARLAEAVGGLPLERQADILRAFSLYFQLANLAEQHHRLRRRREHEQRVPRESLADAFAQLERAGVSRRQLAAAGRGIALELVLTAHPTEATRRTVLAAHVRLDRLLGQLDDPALPRSAREEVEAALAEEITGLWQTDEVRSQRPRVVDEIRHGLWFFEQSLLDAGPLLVRDVRRRLPEARMPLRFGTWIGGDQDGNPAAGPATIGAALDRARQLALTRYRSEVRELASNLGLASGLVEVSDELVESLARDERALPTYARRIGDQNADEPYRRKLSFVWHRLGETLTRRPGGYGGPDEFAFDLEIVDRSLRANRGARLAATGGSRHSAAGSSCSGSTSRSSMCACTHPSSPGRPPEPGGRLPRRPAHRRGTARTRWTRSSSPERAPPPTCRRRSTSPKKQAPGYRRRRCSRRSTTCAQRPG